MSKKIEVFLYNKIFLMLGLNFGYLNLSKEKKYFRLLRNPIFRPTVWITVSVHLPLVLYFILFMKKIKWL